MKKKIIIFLITLAFFSLSFFTTNKKIAYAETIVSINDSGKGVVPGQNYTIEITGLTQSDITDGRVFLYTYDQSGKIIREDQITIPSSVSSNGSFNISPITNYSIPEGTTVGALSLILAKETTAKDNTAIKNYVFAGLTEEEAIKKVTGNNIYSSTTTKFTNVATQQVEKIQEETNNENLPGWLNNSVTSKNPIVNKNTSNNFIPTFTTFADLTTKTNKIVTIAMGIAGGIAFLLIVIGAFQIVLSAGNPDRVKAGKEMITAALSGLFLIIFSVFILKLIGADILKIPGFE